MTAEHLRLLHDLGTIERGKIADLIIVNGDPLQDISTLREVETVVQSGRVVHERNAEKLEKPTVPIPNTISQEAQEYLRSVSPWEERLKQSLRLDSLDDWKAAHAASELRWKEPNARVVREMVADTKIRNMGGVEVHVVTPKNYDAARDDKALLYIHGGGYCYGSAEGSHFLSVPIAHYAGLRLFSIEYRLAPQRKRSSPP